MAAYASQLRLQAEMDYRLLPDLSSRWWHVCGRQARLQQQLAYKRYKLLQKCSWSLLVRQVATV